MIHGLDLRGIEYGMRLDWMPRCRKWSLESLSAALDSHGTQSWQNTSNITTRTIMPMIINASAMGMAGGTITIMLIPASTEALSLFPSS